MIGSTPRHAVPEPLLLALLAAGSSSARAALAGPPRDRAAAAKHAQLAERTAAGASGRMAADPRPPPRSGRSK